MATARRKYRTVAISFGREPLVRVLAAHAIIASSMYLSQLYTKQKLKNANITSIGHPEQ